MALGKLSRLRLQAGLEKREKHGVDVVDTVDVMDGMDRGVDGGELETLLGLAAGQIDRTDGSRGTHEKPVPQKKPVTLL